METQVLELEVGKEYSFVGEEQKYIYVEKFGGGSHRSGGDSYKFIQDSFGRGEIKKIIVVCIPFEGLELRSESLLKLNEHAWVLPCEYTSDEKNSLDKEEFSRLKKILEEKK
jgi:hypothetical protein